MQDHIKELKEIAIMYYNKGMTQNEIAKNMNYSRPTISRMLNEAREKGIVTIYISETRDDLFEVEATLRKYFNLKEVKVVSVPENDIQLKRKIIAREAANVFIKYLKNDQIIGVGWGKTLYEVAKDMPEVELNNCTIYQLCGNIDTGEKHNFAHEIINTFANKLSLDNIRALPCPIVVENVSIVEAMYSDCKISNIIKLSSKCDVMIVNISELSTNHCLYVCDYMTIDDISYLESHSAEGSICSRFFDCHGNLVPSPLDKRTISVQIETIRKTKTVMTCVVGKNKSLALYNALRGDLIDVLTVDLETALEIIKLAKAE